MWEHVPLAWALISLATSESTQELLAERETFHKVKSPWGSLGPGSFALNFGSRHCKEILIESSPNMVIKKG